MLLMNAGALKGPFAGISIMDFAADCVSAWDFDANDRPSRTAEHSLSPAAGRRVWRDTQEFDGRWEPVTLHR
jgi:hypothetical protein